VVTPGGAPLDTGQDLELRCVECSLPFVFGVGEQQWFADRGYERPKRCLPCRRMRTATIAAETADVVFTDRTLCCCSCHRPFVFTEQQQRYNHTMGAADPMRCQPCRAARRAKRSLGASEPAQ
jgi:hypothetical protein